MNYNFNNLTTNNNSNFSQSINMKINENKLQELLHNFCSVKTNNEIVVNYKYFKIINTFIDKNSILNYLIFIVENVLKNYDTFIVHVNIEKLTLLEIDKNRDFIQNMSNILRDRFPDKLELCFIYEGSFIFKQVYNLLSLFVDKKTLKKIKFND